MTLKTLFSLYTLVTLIFCLGLFLFPAFWITLYGATPDAQATVLLRLVGALFGGLAVMAWVGRSAEPSKSRDAMVLGLSVLNSLAALASVWGALSGVYNQFAWGPVAIFALCAVGFFLVGRASLSASTPK
jgi:hypothetical protein